jgi:hypothetical protein
VEKERAKNLTLGGTNFDTLFSAVLRGAITPITPANSLLPATRLPNSNVAGLYSIHCHLDELPVAKAMTFLPAEWGAIFQYRSASFGFTRWR